MKMSTGGSVESGRPWAAAESAAKAHRRGARARSKRPVREEDNQSAAKNKQASHGAVTKAHLVLCDARWVRSPKSGCALLPVVTADAAERRTATVRLQRVHRGGPRHPRPLLSPQAAVTAVSAATAGDVECASVCEWWRGPIVAHLAQRDSDCDVGVCRRMVTPLPAPLLPGATFYCVLVRWRRGLERVPFLPAASFDWASVGDLWHLDRCAFCPAHRLTVTGRDCTRVVAPRTGALPS